MKGPLGVCLVGTHPEIQATVPLASDSNMAEILYNSYVFKESHESNVIVDSHHVECHPVANTASYIDIKNHNLISNSHSGESQPKVTPESHNNIECLCEDKLIALNVVSGDDLLESQLNVNEEIQFASVTSHKTTANMSTGVSNLEDCCTMEDGLRQTDSDRSSVKSRNCDLTVHSPISGSKVHQHFMKFLAKSHAITCIVLVLLVWFGSILFVVTSNHVTLFNKSEQYTTVNDTYNNPIVPLIYSNHVLRRPWMELTTDCTDIVKQISEVHRKHRDKHRHSLCWRYGSDDCLSF
jgi:hypothetical protein